MCRYLYKFFRPRSLSEISHCVISKRKLVYFQKVINIADACR